MIPRIIEWSGRNRFLVILASIGLAIAGLVAASHSPVDATPWVPRAHGREETYQQDLDDWDRVAEELRTLARRVVLDIDREGRPAARVGIKVRYRPFITVSRSLTLPAPTNDPEALADAAVSLLDRVERDRPVRLLGVRLEMTEPEGGY